MIAPIADPITVGQTPTDDQLARLSVSPSPKPIYDPATQRLVELPPVYRDLGLWAVWGVEDMTPVEVDESVIAAIEADKKLRLTLWEDIKAERNRRSQAGGYKVGDKWFHSDTFSRTQQLGLVIAGANAPAVPWKTMDGSFITMSPILANQIFAAAAAGDAAIFAYAEQLRALILAAKDPALITIKNGWPLIYGE
jgi:hypothetical protein